MLRIRKDFIYVSYLLIFLMTYAIVDISNIFGESLQIQFKASVLFLLLISSILLVRLKLWIINSHYLWFVAYFVFCALSLLWSYDIKSTINSLISLLSMMLVVISLISRAADVTDFSRALYFATLIFLIFNLLALVLPRELSFIYLQGTWRFSGFTYSPHALARVAALLVISGSFLYSKKNITLIHFVASLILASYILVLTDSRQAIVISVVCLAIQLRLKSFHREEIMKAIPVMLVVGAFAFLFFIFDSFDSFDVSRFSRADNVDEIYSLTGRIYIWESVIQLIAQRPVLGYGFGSGPSVISSYFYTDSGWSTGSAHNTFLQAMLELGLFGLAFFIIIFANAFLVVFRSKSVFVFNLALFLLVLSFLERGVAGFPDMLFVVLMLVFLLAKLESNSSMMSNDNMDTNPNNKSD